ncbi:MAG: ROK family protein [Minisyncoccota bacterium]
MYILADIGGTKTRIATSEDLSTFSEPVIFDTVAEYENGLPYFIEQVKAAAQGKSIDRLVIGMPGTPAKDHRSTFISGASTILSWSGKAIAERIGNELGTDVTMENDTALVGLGEAMFGAGKGADIVVYITVSTGVGGVRIVGGTIDRVARGSEMGGQYLSMEPMLSLENLVSGTAIRSKYGKHPKELGKESPVWEELARILAFGLHNSLLHWSPERVVLGGSMFNEIGISVERVQHYLTEINVKMPVLPEIVHSSLGDVGGLYGGLARLTQLRSSNGTA